MKRQNALIFASLAAAIMVASCSSAYAPKPMVDAGNIADPSAFGHNLFHIAASGTAKDWGTQLTAERRAMGDEYVTKHFAAWRPILLELAQTFGGTADSTEFRLHENGLEFQFDKKWNLLFRVKNEDGGLKINQD